MSFIINPYVYAAPVDPDCAAFLTATGITDPTISGAVCTLVTSLKSANLWTKLNAIYPMVGGTATTHMYNLRNPANTNAAFRLNFVGGWTHSSTGAKPNGINAYANTFLSPSVTQSVNSNGMGMYITQLTVSGIDAVQMGCFVSTTSASLVFARPTLMGARLNGSVNSISIIGGEGSFDVQRTAAATTKFYKNGTSLQTYNSGGTLPNFPIGLGNINLSGVVYTDGWVNSEFRLAYISSGLNDSEISNLRTLIQAFQTTLSRQV